MEHNSFHYTCHTVAKRTLLILFGLATLTFSLWAQQGKEVLHYIFPQFEQGVVLLKNGTENRALLNYNAATEEMLFYQNDKILALAPATVQQVDTVYINDRKFTRLNDKFVEILHQGDYDLFVQHKCRIIPPGKPSGYGGTSQTSSTTTYSSWSTDGRFYDLQLPDDFQIKSHTTYFIRKNGTSQKINTLKQIKGLYKKKKSAFDDYTKTHKVKFENYFAVAALIDYLEKK